MANILVPFIIFMLAALAASNRCTKVNSYLPRRQLPHRHLRQLWTSTGFCPPTPHQDFKRYIQLDSVKHNIKMLGALPYKGNSFQIRIHWLLDLVTIDPNGHYNFSCLDQLVATCTQSGLRIGFELMGNPGGRFTNFEDNNQVLMWYQLVYETVSRYKHLHSSWNYESWNEPDHDSFDGMNMTTHGYLNYWDACEKGVHDADPRALFGGPGASCRLTSFSKRCWAIMDHITRGANYFTGRPTTRLDFISFHKKGARRGHPGNSTLLYQSELATIKHINKLYPMLKNVTIYNDEGDPVTGWDRPMLFRADVRYPAMVLRLIHMHLYASDEEFVHYKMTSNDNAFLSYAPHYFTQRTLLAAFTMRNSTGKPFTLFVRKPIYELMSMLGQMRGNVSVAGKTPGECDGQSTTCYISTRTDDQMMVTAWVSNDTHIYTGPAVCYTISVPGDMVGAYYVIRKMDSTRANTYDVWNMLGAPEALSRANIELLWNTTMVYGSVPRRVVGDITLSLSGSGVAQLIVCSKLENLTAPHSLSTTPITHNLLIIQWKDGDISNCFLSYELELRRPGSKTFLTVNSGLLLIRTYQYTSEYGVVGEYRVRTRNILGQTSGYSDTYQHI